MVGQTRDFSEGASCCGAMDGLIRAIFAAGQLIEQRMCHCVETAAALREARCHSMLTLTSMQTGGEKNSASVDPGVRRS